MSFGNEICSSSAGSCIRKLQRTTTWTVMMLKPSTGLDEPIRNIDDI
jgi:hypothetical protein